MKLSSEQLRILGCLIEKSATTPEHYPLSTNALKNACNQKTSRDPVVDFGERQVDEVMRELRDTQWARSVNTAGSRAMKHKHIADEKLGVDQQQLALLCVLALRGPQSAGELNTRTQRHVEFEGLAQVEQVLHQLAERDLVFNVGRQPGQSQDRWVELLSQSEDEVVAVGNSGTASLQGAEQNVIDADVELERQVGESEMEARLAAVEERLRRLEAELGVV